MQFLSRSLTVLIVLALGLALVPAAVAQDDVSLVPFSSETFGVQGVVPDGWTEAAPGVYARGASATDFTSLIIQAAPGMSADQLSNVLLGQLGIDALPDSTGTLETDAFTWTLYEIPVEQMGLSIAVDLALAENDSGTTLVLLQTTDDEHTALHESIFVPVVESLAPLEAGAADATEPPAEGETPTGEEPADDTRDGQVYEDPDGYFSVPIPTNWTVEEREGYTFIASPDELITVSIVVVETEDGEAALAEAWSVVDPDFAKEVEERLDIPVSTLDLFTLYTYEMEDEEEFVIQAEVRLHDGVSYVLIFNADLTAAQQRQAQVTVIDSGFEISAIEQTDLSTVEPLELTDELIAEFEAYIESALETYDTPGASVAIVRDGEVIYANGFGIRNPQGDPVTPETLMLIGSTTKTMTTLLMAQLVDEGVMEWDTPVVEVLPTFEVADPDVTQELTMEHMVCACTGVPRRDLELIFNSDDLSAEDVIESLSTFEFFTDFGEAFQYSNQMVASAGYLATLAAGGEYGSLGQDYVNLVEARIFEPLEMNDTTFSFAEALASDNVAVPYGLYTDFTFQPIPYEVEEAFADPIGPAGGAWSTVLDMAKYMIMQLNAGETPDGTRIVSEENLRHTWQPQVPISAVDDYGLGWIVSDYRGLEMLSHAGNMLGFTSEFTFLPERDLGVVVLTNQRISVLNTAVMGRLFELLFKLPESVDAEIQFSWNLAREQSLEGLDQIELIAEEADTELFTGSFTNDALGDVSVSLTGDGVLIFDAGEFASELWHYIPEEDEELDFTGFVLYDPPLNGLAVRFEEDDEGVYQMTVGEGLLEYEFERVD